MNRKASNLITFEASHVYVNICRKKNTRESVKKIADYIKNDSHLHENKTDSKLEQNVYTRNLAL